MRNTEMQQTNNRLSAACPPVFGTPFSSRCLTAVSQVHHGGRHFLSKGEA
jgi:hypothetical protein